MRCLLFDLYGWFACRFGMKNSLFFISLFVCPQLVLSNDNDQQQVEEEWMGRLVLLLREGSEPSPSSTGLPLPLSSFRTSDSFNVNFTNDCPTLSVKKRRGVIFTFMSFSLIFCPLLSRATTCQLCNKKGRKKTSRGKQSPPSPHSLHHLISLPPCNQRYRPCFMWIHIPDCEVSKHVWSYSKLQLLLLCTFSFL